MLTTRRSFFTGLLAAPAIIAVDRLMPVKAWKPRITWGLPGWIEANGATLSTVDFPELFAVLGNSFGGSGGHFMIPDYSDPSLCLKAAVNGEFVPVGTLAFTRPSRPA